MRHRAPERVESDRMKLPRFRSSAMSHIWKGSRMGGRRGSSHETGVVITVGIARALGAFLLGLGFHWILQRYRIFSERGFGHFRASVGAEPLEVS